MLQGEKGVISLVVVVVVTVVAAASAATTMLRQKRGSRSMTSSSSSGNSISFSRNNNVTAKKMEGHFSTRVISFHEGAILLQLRGVLSLRSGVIPQRSEMTHWPFCRGGSFLCITLAHKSINRWRNAICRRIRRQRSAISPWRRSVDGAYCTGSPFPENGPSSRSVAEW